MSHVQQVFYEGLLVDLRRGSRIQVPTTGVQGPERSKNLAIESEKEFGSRFGGLAVQLG